MRSRTSQHVQHDPANDAAKRLTCKCHGNRHPATIRLTAGTASKPCNASGGPLASARMAKGMWLAKGAHQNNADECPGQQAGSAGSGHGSCPGSDTHTHMLCLSRVPKQDPDTSQL